MRVIASLVLLLTGAANAFVITNGGVAISRASALHAYVPDGLSPEQWKAMQAKEKGKKVGRFDGTSGMKFRSRSMEDYQVGRETGKLKPNMPMENAVQKLNAGKIRPIDIPYMQRPNGKPDNSDLTPKGYWKTAPRGYTGDGITGPAKGGGFKLPWGK